MILRLPDEQTWVELEAMRLLVLKGFAALVGPLVVLLSMLAARHFVELERLVGSPVVGEVVQAAIYFSLALLASRIVKIIFARSPKKRRRVPKLLADLITAAFFAAAFVATAGIFLGDSIGGVLAGSGLMIAVLGFAVRNVVADVLSGVAFGLDAPFRIGDWVDFDGAVKGQVVEIGWRTTRLLRRDATYMILPNSQIARQRITNYSAPRRHYRAQISVVLDHEIEVAVARQVLLDGVKLATFILDDPSPDVRAVSFGLDGITYAVRYWVPSFAEDIDCRDDVLQCIDSALRRAGIDGPRRHFRFNVGELPAAAPTDVAI
ncbi:small-conductance mechanosensitive channel [Mycoplana dimorpha]|uniref:Small-conductance mechanosensitive channel n=1 Tax=Mycoplana dimorpha TaxID=28320 RepID=A0A2T5BIM4_MYCDI|nr:small-conductance mechanosensitive channel [Mycoplana dimorpha]